MKPTKILLLVTALTALTALGTPSVAQERDDRRVKEERLRELRAELRDLERELARDFGWSTSSPRGRSSFFGPNLVTFSANRARLGVVVRTAADDETDGIGAYLESVDPGSAAEEAGLESGDVIVSFEGETLTGRYPPADPDESAPAIKMIDLLRDHEPGDEVTVEYQRAGRTQSTVVTLDGADDFTSRVFVGPSGPGLTLPRGAPGEVRLEVGRSGPGGDFMVLEWSGDAWADIELVGLNPNLGRYFGTEDGLLVVAPPSDESIELQSGDVILSIDGREPRSPARALRILRSYEEGETVNLEIMRDRVRMTVSVEVPERENEFFDSTWNRRWDSGNRWY